MSVNNINSSSPAMMMRGMPRPEPSKLAEDLFSKLDTKGQGYIEKSDLERAIGKASPSADSGNSSLADALFTKLDNDGNGKVTKEEMSATIQKIAAELDGPAPRMRMQGGTPPPPPGGGPGGAQGPGSTSGTQSSQNSNDPADTNGDGTVSEAEALAYELSHSLSASDTSSSSSANTDDRSIQTRAGITPPPPQDANRNGPSFSKDELSAMAQQLDATDNRSSQAISNLVNNFDTADADSDGKVSGSEAKTFRDSQNSSTSSSSSVISDAQFMKQMMQLLQSYGSIGQTAESSRFSASA